MAAKQSTGAARAAELRAKLFGLLVDKSEVQTGSFQINISGIYDEPATVNPPRTIEHDPGVDNSPPEIQDVR